MKLLKPHKLYGDTMSRDYMLLKIFSIQITVQEFYSPHWLEFLYWKRDDDGSYILRKWKKIPLNKYTRLLLKLDKLDSERIRLKAHLDNISEKR